jgi:hypothetical protein
MLISRGPFPRYTAFMHDPFTHLSLPEIEKREMHEETDDPDLGDRIPDAIKDALGIGSSSCVFRTADTTHSDN